MTVLRGDGRGKPVRRRPYLRLRGRLYSVVCNSNSQRQHGVLSKNASRAEPTRTSPPECACVRVRPRASIVSLAPDLGVRSVNKHCALRAFAACSAHSSPLYPPNPLYTVRPARVRSRKRRPWRLVMLTFCAIFPPLFLSAPPVSALARCAAPSQPYCTACASVRELPLCPPPSHPLVPAPSCALGNRGPISSSDPAALIDVLTKRRVHRASLPDSDSTRP